VTARAPRLIAGAVVILILIGLGVVLIPPYASYWQLQNYLSSVVDDAGTLKLSQDVVRAEIVNKAKALGLPVANDDVHVAISPNSVKLDVLYMVQVNVAGYAIDLHFRPTAGG
jgi:hypothetical protein